MKSKLSIILSIFLLTLSSCKKESINNNIETEESIPEGYTKLAFDISIENDAFNEIQNNESNEYPIEYKQPSVLAKSNSKNNIYTSEIISLDELDYRVIYEEPNESAISSDNIKLKASNSLTASNKALVRMANNIKYIVFIYDLNDKLITEKTLTAGGSSASNDNTIILRGGVKYKYKAISYNTTTAPTVTMVNSQPIVSSQNSELLYASGTTSELPFNTQNNTSPNQNPTKLGIVFKHQTARLELGYDFTGFFGTFEDAGRSHGINLSISSNENSDVNPFTTGKFNVFTGKYDETSHKPYSSAFNYIRGFNSPTTSGNTEWKVTTYGPATYNDRAKTYIHSSKNINIPALYLRIKEYKFDKSNDQTEMAELKASVANPIVLKYTKSFNLEIGKSKVITYQYIEPAVTVPNLSGIKFARANLRHKGANTYNTIRIGTHHSNTNSISRDVSYLTRWRFNELKPERFSMVEYKNERYNAAPTLTSFLYSNQVPVSDQGDPCTKAYPNNVWRSPTASELQRLAKYINDNLGTSSSNVQAIGGTHLLFPQEVSTLPKLSTITHNNLILERGGYGKFVANTSPLVNSYQTSSFYSNNNNDSHGYYWSSTDHKYLLIKGLKSNNNVVASVETLPSGERENTMFVRCVRAQ